MSIKTKQILVKPKGDSITLLDIMLVDKQVTIYS